MAEGAGPRVIHCLMLASAGLLFTAVLLFLVPFVFTLQQQNHSVMVVNDDLKSTATMAANDVQSVSDKALNKQQIKVLIDYKLPKGHNIWSSLLNAIERAHVSVVVFSQNYASSKWCLDELVKILDTMKQQGQVVLPVFYGIDPGYVRYQLGSFKQAFETHVQKFDPIVVQNWKTALTEAANLNVYIYVIHDDGKLQNRDSSAQALDLKY